MATILDTLITRLGFETDKSGLKEADKGLGDFKASAIKIAASVGAILGGGLFLNAIANAADETLKWADANGIAVESIGELEFAVQRQGGSVDGLRSSLANLNKSIGEVERGTGRAKLAFEDYDITIKKANGDTKTADELLVDLNKKFGDLSRAKQSDLAAKLGIDKGTIRLLQTAPDELERLTSQAKALGVLSRKDAEAAAKFNDGLTNMAQVINAIKFEIGGFVFEPISKFFKALAEGIAFIKQHKVLTLSFIGILGLLAAAYNAAAIKAGILWLISLGPIALVIAGITALVAAIAIVTEDFVAFFKGQSSFIGDLVEKWPLLGDVIFAVRDAAVFLFDKTVAGFKIWWDWLGTIGQAMIDFVIDPIETAMKAFNKFSGLFKKARGFFGGIGGVSLNQELGIAGAGGGMVSPSIISGGTSTKITKSLSVGAITVDARGGDAKEIAQNVGAAMSEQFKNTVEDFDSPVEK
ncbi:MAG: hypothetical protein KAR40_13885 [Candidatus Sabulitectum sp.]|nr:hypothetical protein [Candidatus Sabulitectum sp.]